MIYKIGKRKISGIFNAETAGYSRFTPHDNTAISITASSDPYQLSTE
jgi:hypothetical protein